MSVMKREPKPFKTLVQYRQDALGIDNVIERHDRIVGESDKGACPLRRGLTSAFEPFVQHVVQEDVRETGRDYAPLRGALSRPVQETAFDGSCLQPFVDHPSDDAVRDSLVEERPKLRVGN